MFTKKEDVVNLHIKHFRVLICPPFWGSVFLLGIREYWFNLFVLSLVFNGGLFLKGEILEFVFSTAFIFIFSSVFFVFYVIYKFSAKTIKMVDFREQLSSSSYREIVREVLGIEIEKPKVANYKPLSEDLPDTTSKIGFAIVIGIKIVTILGILYISFLVANR